MSPFVLLIALMASPLFGILLAAMLARPARLPASLRSLAWLPAAAGAGVALIAAWLLRGQPAWEAIVGNWSPISFTGLPLVLAGFAPSAGILIAWITLYFLDSLKPPDTALSERHPTASALIIPSLSLVAFANNLVTLLVGLGLTDLLTAYLALRRQDGERNALIRLTLNGFSVALLTLVVAMHAAGGNSLHLPLARLDPSTAPALALAIAMRLNFAPFRTSPSAWGDLRMAAGAVGGLLVLARLPALGVTRLPEWFYALALVSALLTLAIAILEAEHRGDSLAPAVATAGAYLAGASAVLAMPGVTAAATIAWLVGAALIGQPGMDDEPLLIERVRLVSRTAGALCLIGLPLTVGFVGQAGVVATWTERGVSGWLFALAWVVALALLIYVLLRIILDSTAGHAQQARLIPSGDRVDLPFVREVVGRLAALAPVLIFGVAPALLTAGSFTDALVRNGIAGWLGWIIAVAAGALLWWLEPRWRPAVHRIRGHAVGVLDLGWFYSLLGGAVARLRSPFSRAFTLLEGDGALLWAIIVALLIVLISRPGGP
ncbi:MAG: hypothetical protein RMN52_03680 [Anaerolineae bacterium]|nr:hypothetical protein [Candidatus Roseilinea sp.]MDW8449082.1 hypothetical protein [Anaerolineae bacterium]